MNYDKNYPLHLQQGREKQKQQKEERTKRYNISPSKCSRCSTALCYKQRHNQYCSHSCSAKSNNEKRGTPHKGNCLKCSKKLENDHRTKFCSRLCYSEYRKAQRLEEMNSAEDLSRWDKKTVRNYLIEKGNHTCSICNTKEWLNQPVPLVMDHINGDPYNNHRDNLRIVCAMCDAQLPTYKGRNKGNGRHARRQRYKEGKSY